MNAIKAEPLVEDELSAWFEGRRPRRLLAFPFGGPLPTPHYAKGMDIDREFFSERTDIKPRWLDFRVVDWHHGKDEVMGRTPLGKADRLGSLDGQKEPDDEGWWVDQWFTHGERRIELVRALVARGATLYGSSESVAGMTKKADTGEILVWPYWRQTLSTSPQNVHSVLRPVKAALEDALTTYDPAQAFWVDVADELRELGSELRLNLTPGSGDDAAKSGRVLSSLNEADIDEAVNALLGSAEKLRSVLARHRKE